MLDHMTTHHVLTATKLAVEIIYTTEEKIVLTIYCYKP